MIITYLNVFLEILQYFNEYAVWKFFIVWELLTNKGLLNLTLSIRCLLLI